MLNWDQYFWITAICFVTVAIRSFWFDHLKIWKRLNGTKAEREAYYVHHDVSWLTTLIFSIGLAAGSQLTEDFHFFLYLAPFFFVGSFWLGKDRNFAVSNEFEVIHNLDEKKRLHKERQIARKAKKNSHGKNEDEQKMDMGSASALAAIVLFVATVGTLYMAAERWIEWDYFFYVLVTDAAGVLMLFVYGSYKAAGAAAKPFLNEKDEEED